MARLTLFVLGPFQVELDGQPANGFESNKVRALLAYLAVESDRPHTRTALAGLLWPDYTDRSALNNLRSALANLRQAISDPQAEPPFLNISRDTIQFNLASDHRLDLAALLNMTGQTIEQLEASLSVCRGSFMEGFSLSDSPPFEEWLLIRREQANRLLLETLQRLASHYERLGDFSRAMGYARRRLELEPWDEDAHRQLMRALACNGQRNLALGQYEACRRLLQAELGVEPGRETTALYQNIRTERYPPPSALPEIVSREESPFPGQPPYKGLQYFNEGDVNLFFGREELTARLLTRLDEYLDGRVGQARFLAILGASGSGKSSILRAGLVAALIRRQALQGQHIVSNLSVRVITPTAHPLEALALGLVQPEQPLSATTSLLDQLGRDPRSLHLEASRAAQHSGIDHLLLVVDQFEELFNLCHAESERRSFLDNLMYAVLNEGPLVAVVCLRADFYVHCAPYEELRLLLSQHQEYIGAMGTAELRRAIEGPARQGGWELEPGLVDLLLREVGSEPGALPLLSHALLETWLRRRGRCLTLAGYSESGGVHGAIARTAETTFNQLTSEQQTIARSIFLRLTELGEGTQDTRRRVELSELIAGPQQKPLVQAVLKRLADARLVTVSSETAEVAHEALIREWGTLLEWLNENREGLRLHRQLTQAAQEWDHLERDSEALYRGLRLAQAREWAKQFAGDLNLLERDFLLASQAAQQAQEAIETERQQRELEAARALSEAQRQRAEAEQRRAEEQTRAAGRLRRRSFYLALALGTSLILLIMAAWLGQMANRNAQTAQIQTRLASSRELAAAAVNNLQIDPERSALLALQALNRSDTLEARNALHRALPELHILRLIPAHRQSPGLAYSPDGARLATIGIDGDAKIWEADTGQELLRLSIEPESGLAIAYSPDGKWVATVWSSRLQIWDASTGKSVWVFPGVANAGTVNRVSFSPDSRRVAIANLDGAPRIWDLRSGAELFSLQGYDQVCDAIAFSPDGTQIATGDQGGTVRLWDSSAGQELLSLGQGGIIHNLAYSPDGTRLAAANEDGTLAIWDTASGQETLRLPRMSGLYSVAIMPDGQRLVTAHQDGTAKIWDAVSGQLLLTLAGHVSTVVDVAASPDGNRIATAGYDGTVRIWDTTPGREALTVNAHSDQAWDVAYSTDGSQIATVGLDGYARIWDARTGQLTFELSAGDPLTSLAYSPDGNSLAAGSANGMVYAWDLDSEDLIRQVAGHQTFVTGVAFSPDGTRLVSSSWDGSQRVWELSTGREIASFTGHAPMGYGQGIAFSPDEKTVFSSGADGYGRQWEADNGREVQNYFADGREVYGLAVSPDGRLLALGLQDGEVDVWDIAQHQRVWQLKGHAGLVARLAFNYDSSRLASAAFDGYAKVWDVGSGQELFTLYGNTSNVFGVAFSPDGAYLATSGGDGSLRLFTLQMDELVRLAQARLTRSLSEDECKQYLHLEACPDQ